MSKKNRKSGKGQTKVTKSAGSASQGAKTDARSARKTRRKLKNFFLFVVSLAVLGSISAVAISALQKNWEESHDLTVIGNGTPTIVQIHDPKCPKCKRLMSNAKAALGFYEDEFQFKIADITTGPGQKLRRTHNASTISLLIFNGNGELKRTLSGVKDVDILELEFAEFLKRYQRG